MNLTAKERQIVNQLKRQMKRDPRGYEDSLSFARGFIQALKLQGVISAKFARELHENFSIEEEELMSQFDETDYPELEDYLQDEYGRVLL